MPQVSTNGIRLSYQRSGTGDPVLFIMGSGAAGRVWTMHQTPAVVRAGYQAIVFDNRGVGDSDAPPGKYALTDMVADTKGLIEALGIGPCRIVGYSLGAMIAQELAITEPALVRSAVLLAARARSDRMRRAMDVGDQLLRESGIRLPPKYEAVRTVLEMLSPASLNDDDTVHSWLEILELTGNGRNTAEGQSWASRGGDRRGALRGVTVPCRVIAFRDDLICPPHLVAEVSDAIPDCDFVEIPAAGHLGHLEQPDAVNEAIVEFLRKY
ncbi:alpha/beta fold hydrolase [Kitasatospora sp. CB01950]|uniref:alpha/beta fold hydrolase n=1 Tax=Kitasatospora sp. CB01950 TaxID=1703930 RepID=UPI00093F5E00|nr:alpha/beta hydrolase [Kitasatospora sp. CB01950]OKI92977.1 alpha/beta hydrolase [Kitasatospora sp. CB01950]